MYADKTTVIALIDQLTPDMDQALRSSLRLHDAIPAATLAASRTALVKLGLARKSSRGDYLVNTSTGRSVARRLVRLARNA